MTALAAEHLEIRRYLGSDFPATLVATARAAYRPRWRDRWIEDDGGIVLSVSHLDRMNDVIRQMDSFESDLFAATLAWVVCLDEAMWAWAPLDYQHFRELTRFPKLIGTQSLHAHPLQAVRMVGGREGNFLHHRLGRYAMLSTVTPAIHDVITRIARMQEMPVLLEVFQRCLEELRIVPVPVVDPVVDPLPADAICDWLMPRLQTVVLERPITARRVRA